MIKHHPSTELLKSFVSGELSASLSAGVAIHTDMCRECQEKIARMTEQAAEIDFEQAFLHNFIVEDSADLNAISELDFDDMIDSITDDKSIAQREVVQQKYVEFKEQRYQLPAVLSNSEVTNPLSLGKLARSRVQFDEGEIHASLLHIEPGGSVPEHTHNGYELTVLLEGSFSDEQGEYVAGDFIMLNQAHEHHPISEHGCLCYTVANDSLKFTQGINKLLNPIGSFIY